MAIWGRRRREREQAEAQQQENDAVLARKAQNALVKTDERIRTTRDELGFAQAELGDAATKDLREGLDAVATHMREAFQLHQLNHDDIPDTPEELRTRNARIVQLCEWADQVLDERTESLRERVEKVRDAPRTLQRVRDEAAALRERIPAAKQTVERLRARYSPEAMHRIGANSGETEQLLDFADHSADVVVRRKEAGRRDEAMVALETATEAVRRATTILDAVDDFEIEAMRAQTTLADVIADSRADVTAARQGPQTSGVPEAIASLEGALRALPAPGQLSDPFADLSRISAANAALDRAVEKARERAARPIPSLAHVRHEVDAADRAIAIARNLITGHRGWIGADARTRLTEAERTRLDIDELIEDEDTREEAQRLARRTTELANEALQYAQRDIDSSRPNDWGGGGYGGGYGRRGGGMTGGDIMGGLIGGALLGGLIGDIFD
ncbi:hypothetical protein [Microbacterium indicum]|uniref:hypothetical protein n=1 Tax=Microbacterium indicum TaxID=358100 RepID=UPI0003FA26A4|nr:hypothetical protein [Microbacterium indicum]